MRRSIVESQTAVLVATLAVVVLMFFGLMIVERWAVGLVIGLEYGGKYPPVRPRIRLSRRYHLHCWPRRPSPIACQQLCPP